MTRVLLPGLACLTMACVDSARLEGPATEALPLDFTAGSVSDYLVQDVCASNANPNRVVNADPVACPAGFARRDLFPAESMPYHKTDIAGVQLSDSFVLRSYDISQLLYVSTMDFTKIPQVDQGSFLESNRAAAGLDGWNLIEAAGNRVGFIGTQDGSGVYQEFFGARCLTSDAWLPDDAWVLFPNAAPSGVTGSGVFPMAIRRSTDQQCPSGRTNVTVTWEGPLTLTYTSGKKLPTLKSYHTVTGATGNVAMEVFFFTPQYGLTRWEAWTSTGSAVQGNCNGGTVAGNLKRGDCRDWTRVVADPTFWSNATASGGGYSPYAYNIPNRFVEGNRLRNGDFGGIDPVEPHWQRYHAANGVLTHWTVGTHVLAGWDTAGVNGAQNFNHHLTVQCGGACSGNVVFQDATSIPAYTTLIEYGVSLWANAAGKATLAMFSFDGSGRMIANESVPVTLTTKPQAFRRALRTPVGAKRVRFAVYPSTGTPVHIDDAWVVPK